MPPKYAEFHPRVFFCPALARRTPEATRPLEAELPADEAVHAIRVLRLRPGDAVRLFDGQGVFHEGRISGIGKRDARVEVVSCHPSNAEPRAHIALVVALTKGRKPDLVIQKCVELGVADLFFFESARSVARAGENDTGDGSRERWDKIVIAACKQCGRASLMPIRLHRSLAETLAALPSQGLRLAFWENADPAGSTTQPSWGDPPTACALIGPEGGFTQDEIKTSEDAGFRAASLGRRILRAETAALAAATLLLAAVDELGPAIPSCRRNHS